MPCLVSKSWTPTRRFSAGIGPPTLVVRVKVGVTQQDDGWSKSEINSVCRNLRRHSRSIIRCNWRKLESVATKVGFVCCVRLRTLMGRC